MTPLSRLSDEQAFTLWLRVQPRLSFAWYYGGVEAFQYRWRLDCISSRLFAKRRGKDIMPRWKYYKMVRDDDA